MDIRSTYDSSTDDALLPLLFDQPVPEDDTELGTDDSAGSARSTSRAGLHSRADFWYFQQVARYPLLVLHEDLELARAVRTGNPLALSRLITGNLRLVLSIARRFRCDGLDLDDLIQEGNLGLIQAARKFDPQKGTRFSTYATFWIKQSIARAIQNKARMIRIPVGVYEDLAKVRKAEAYAYQHRGELLTPAELAQTTGLNEGRITAILQSINYMRSLDEPRNVDTGEPLLSFIENTGSSNPEDDVEAYLVRRCLEQLTSILTLKERTVLDYLFGLNFYPCLTYLELALRLGLTATEIKRIRETALNKLKRAAKKQQSLPPPDPNPIKRPDN